MLVQILNQELLYFQLNTINNTGDTDIKDDKLFLLRSPTHTFHMTSDISSQFHFSALLHTESNNSQH